MLKLQKKKEKITNGALGVTRSRGQVSHKKKNHNENSNPNHVSKTHLSQGGTTGRQTGVNPNNPDSPGNPDNRKNGAPIDSDLLRNNDVDMNLNEMCTLLGLQ